MSAQIDTTADGAVRFAGRERKRWWGIGNQITDPYDVDQSLREALLNFRYEVRGNSVELMQELERADNDGAVSKYRSFGPAPSRYNRSIIKAEHGQPDIELGGCGTRWHPHQPGDILEFFQRVSSKVGGGLQMNTAGSLRRGGMIFAAAQFDKSIKVLDCEMVDMYLTGLTSIFGSTILGVTGIQVECANTAEYFVRQDTPRITYSHVAALDVAAAVEAIGIVDLDAIARLLNRCAVIPFDAEQRGGFWQHSLLGDRPEPVRSVEKKRIDAETMRPTTERVLNPAWLKFDRERGEVRDCYRNGPGQELPSRDGTLFGAWSAVTDFCDHVRRSTVAGRGASALVGSGPDSIRAIKSRAMRAVVDLAA